jgi:hypothetical protein
MQGSCCCARKLLLCKEAVDGKLVMGLAHWS